MNLLSQDKKQIKKTVHTLTDLAQLNSFNALTGWADDSLPKAAQDVSARAKNLPVTFTRPNPALQPEFSPWYFYKMN